MTTYKATVTSTDEENVYQAQVRDFQIKFDLTGRDNGYEEGVTPKEAMLCSLGACESIVAGSFYRKQHFTYRSFYLVLNGEVSGDRPGYDEITMDAHFDTDKSKADAEKFVEFMENTCPVRDNLVNTVPIKSKVVVE
ncbi:MAG: OsmC family protein [Limosilactobacillus sp.]|jgi:uncharacterized OsmC-like protein|uniref:OsmC family protein n=1 Tax=Limosilactobacillus sp. TaxID=2773925 RepID=UPI0025C2C3BA|nr:OsmC family protein [Limosilactobacillus sp.]MCI1975579.1 OsmC family protein [Limosilactobacillus sp.]MCI2031470.1 OsmC family protein [Limosilactobacillus sp.]